MLPPTSNRALLNPLPLLLVGQMAALCSLAQILERAGFTSELVETVPVPLANRWAAILLLEAPDICSTLEHLKAQSYPLWVLTTTETMAIAVAALRAGAKDCIAYDDTERLLTSLQEHLGLLKQPQILRERFLELSHDLLMIQDFKRQYCYFNQAWESLLGYTQAELQELRLLSLVHPEDRERRLQADAGLRVGQTLRNFECRYRCKDDSYRWISVTIVPFLEEGLIYGIGRDITLAKQKEQELQHTLEALRHSEQRLSLHLQQTALAVIEWDVKGDISAWNRGAEHMFGFTCTEAIGKNIYTFLVPPHAHAYVYGVSDRLLAGELVHGVNENLTKSGQIVLCEWYNTPLINRAGEVATFASFAINMTERQQTEQALRKSEARWRSLAENIPDLITTVDEQGKIQSFNRLLSYLQPSDMEQADFDQFVHPRDQKVIRQALAHTFATGVLSSCETLSVGEDGGYHWFSNRIVPVKIGEQTVAATIIATNITEKKHAQEQQASIAAKLHKSEATLRLVTENIHDMICLHEPDGYYIYVSPSVEHTLGYVPSEVLGKAFYSFIHPDDLQTIYNYHVQLLNGQEVDSFICRMLHKNGTYVWIEGYAQYIQDEDNNVTRIVTSSRDITSRKLTEERLRESEERFRSLAENMHDIISLYEPDGTLLYASPSFEETLGYVRDEVLGKNSFELVHPEDQHLFERQLIHSGEQLASSTMFRMSKKSGGYVWLENSTTPILDDWGRVTRLHCVGRDITERKQSEVLLQRAIEDRLAREHMEVSMAELKKLNQLKDDFLSTVSHELRTPVTNMKIAIHMLKHSELESSQYTYLTILESECNREINLINDLLDLQRLETGCKPLYVETLELKPWLTQLMTPFYGRLLEKKLTFEVILQPEVDSFSTDRSSLERILLELVNNACKYTPIDEGIRVIVSLGQNHTVQFQVVNSGVVIPPEELARIFEKFYRIPNRDPWEQSGTGLGLCLVQELVLQLQGEIEARSEADKTVFIVTLPNLTPD